MVLETIISRVNSLCSAVTPTSKAERDFAGLLTGRGAYSHVGASGALVPISCPTEMVPLDVLPHPVRGDPQRDTPMPRWDGAAPRGKALGGHQGVQPRSCWRWEEVVLPLFREITDKLVRD